MTTLNYKKTFSIAAIIVVTFYVVSSTQQFSTSNISTLSNGSITSEIIDDEITPLCNGVTFNNYDGLTDRDLKGMKIDVVQKDKWMENFFGLLTDDQTMFIKPEFKKSFNASINFQFENFNCVFSAEIKLTGDLQDHIRDQDPNQTSLNVTLLDGSIFGIVEFKLFLPETRYGVGELIITSILERFNMVTPKTFETNMVMNNAPQNRYIFQEKFVKEFIESNNYREGPILQVTEDFFWEERNQKDNNSLFMFPEVTNNAWSRRSLVNQHISLNALERYSSLFFGSSDMNNIKVGEAFLTYDTTAIDYEKLSEFDTLMIALDAVHGLEIANRNFYYDNIGKELIPIYYDGNSQIADRVHYKNAPIDLCDQTTEYIRFNDFSGPKSTYRYLCVNDYTETAQRISSSINFDENDIYQDVLDKGGKITIEMSREVLNNFKLNLNYLSLPKIKNDSRNSSFNKNGTLFPNTTDYGAKFIFYDYKDQKGNICNQYLTICEQLKESENFFSKDFRKENPKVYPLGVSVDSFANLGIDNSSEDEKGYTSYGNPEINVDSKSRKFSVNFSNNNQKVLITNGTLFSGWTFNVKTKSLIEPGADRLDINSLTGCLSFYDTNVQNISINIDDMFCEDALNFIRVKGTIDSIYIEDSASDAVDIDFSNLVINSINIINAKNDCVDFSKSKVIITEITVKNCYDKALSIGESTELNLSMLEVSNASIGIAVKDSSNVTVDNIDILSADMCIAIYRKKQEFGPARLITKNYNCEATEDDFLQLGSEFIALENNLHD